MTETLIRLAELLHFQAHKLVGGLLGCYAN